MARPIHFEIPADPQRAIAFYSAALGWKAQKFDGMEYWLMATGEQGEPGIDGGIAPLLVGAFFAFLVALMPGEGGEHYYWEIMLPRDRAGTHRRVRHAALRESATTATGMSRDQPARMSR